MDALGRRISKTEGGKTTTYLYDGMDIVQERQGNTVNPILTGPGIDQRFARNEGSERTYFLTDALGSTRALTNTAGEVIQRYDYTPYGQTQTLNGSTSNPTNTPDGNGMPRGFTTTAPGITHRGWGGLSVRIRLACEAG